MNSDETVKNAGDRERAPLTDNSVGQRLRSDELSLERLYIELTGESEAQARSVFMFTALGRREVEYPTATEASWNADRLDEIVRQ
jgi:hypothetical protein